MAASSLPRELTLESAPPPHIEALLRPAARRQDAVVLQRLGIITPALNYPAQSRLRADAVGLASCEAMTSSRTLYRWIGQYEANGLRGLARAAVCQAVARRVCISRSFDQAFRVAGYSEPALATLTAEFERSLKGLWTSRAEQAGVTEIRRLAEFLLLELCEARGG